MVFKLLEEDEKAEQKNSFRLLDDQETQPDQQSAVKSSDPLTLKGTAGAYLSGLGGGAGGIVPDLANIIPPGIIPGVDLINRFKAKGSEELATGFREDFGVNEPANAVERILEKGGEFAGVEGLFGTALGGPTGALTGVAHGTASGILYGSLKELGLSDPWALGITTLVTLSPVAARKLWPKLKGSLKKGKGFTEALEETGEFTQKEAQQLLESSPPPPPGGGAGGPSDPATESFTKGEPLFKNLVSEDELLDTVRPLIEQSMESELRPRPKIVDPEVPLRQRPPSIDSVQIEKDIGNVVSKTSIPNTTMASKSLRNEINKLSKSEYKDVSNLYTEARTLNRNVESIQPQMGQQLDNLVEEISESQVPSSVQKDIRDIAKKLSSRVGSETKGYKPITNQELISQIESNNQKINHDYLQGRPSNAYIRLNQILEEAVESSAEAHPQALEAWKQARGAYRNWASRFGSKDILPWRDPSNAAHSKLFKSIENPDQIQVLENILGDHKRGRVLVDSVKRHYTENKYRPFTKDLNKIDTAEYQDLFKELSQILDIEQRLAIDDILETAREPVRQHERAVEAFSQAKELHSRTVKGNAKELSDWKEHAKDINKKFPYKTDASVLKELNSVRGIKRIESALPNTEEGQQAVQQIKDYTATRLLTNGKIVPSDKALPLKKILNDVDSRRLLEYTLGKEKTNKLADIVNRAGAIDTELAPSKKWFKNARTIGKLMPGVGGGISKAEAVYDLWRMFRPAVEQGEYGTISLELINEILQAGL